MGDSTEKKVVTMPSISQPNSAVSDGLSGAATDIGFKRKSVRGGAAAVVGQVVGTVLQIGTTIVLARILSPADYGLQAMVVTLTAFFSLFKDAGLSTAAVQRETLTHEQMSTLFWINLAVGSLLTIVIAAMGPVLAAFYRDRRLTWVTVASSSVFFFSSLSVSHSVLLDRAMRFTTSVKIGILSGTVGTVIAIGMAELGCGYWSLICQTISLPIITTAAVWIVVPWIPGRPRWTPEIRSMLRFGGTVSLNSVVVYIAYNTEKILLGRFWGAAPLGLYTRAYQLANLPVQQLINAIGVVAFPGLSRLQGDAGRLRRSFLKANSFLLSLAIPVVVACGLFSNEAVLIVLGPKWIGAALVLRLLSPTVLVFALVNPFSWFLRATGRVGRSLKIALLIVPVVILGVLAGLRYGPPGVALGYSVAMVLLFLPLVAWAKHGTGLTTSDYWECIKRPVIAGFVSGGVGWVVNLIFRSTLTPIPLLILELTVFFAVYAWLLLLVMGQLVVYKDLVSHLSPRNEDPPASV